MASWRTKAAISLKRIKMEDSDSDDNLFQKVLNNRNHVLHKLLPEQSTHDYYLRPRSHDRSLSVKTDNDNFLSRLLFKDMY